MSNMSNQRLLFIYNPHSGVGKVKSQLSDILEVMVQAGYSVTVHPTQAAGDAVNVAAERAGDYDLVVCCGGDGTLDETVSGLMRSGKNVALGYIPAGSTNDFAASLDLPKNMKKAAEVAVSGKDFPCDVGLFGDKHFIYVAAFGLFTDVSYETPQEDKRVLGRLAYLLAGVRALGDVHPIHMRVSCGGQTAEADVIDGLVCSTMSVGGFKPRSEDFGICLNDGKAEVLVVPDFKNLIDFSNAAGCLLRGNFQNEYFITYQTDCIRFEFDEPVAWTLDGEYGGDRTEVEIRINRQAIRILVPQ